MFEKKTVTIAYTVEQCNLCNKETKRKFKEGDCLFLGSSKCSYCNGNLVVEKIFGETIEK